LPAVNALTRHPAALDPAKLLQACEFAATRRSGPGGQHRNKVSTAAVLRHVPSGISAEASERRSQAENRRIALFRLRVNLALEVRRPAPDDRLPSAPWNERTRGGRISVSDRHDDYPAMLAEALDFVAARGGDVRGAAEALGVTSSQLVRFLQREPRAMALVNALRARGGLRPLK
jgi:hypothetical protein